MSSAVPSPEVRERCFYLIAYIQPTDYKCYQPLSFRWAGSDMERKVTSNFQQRTEQTPQYEF